MTCTLPVPIITVVTPSFNQGEFLAETIESVISQQGDFLLDYLIVDGGSCDNSLDIIKHYHALLHNGQWPVACRGITCRWLSENDRGQADALMKGFRMARGEILAWLNSDDIFLPGALQVAAGFFRDHSEVGLVYGDAHYCDTTGALIGRYRTGSFDLDTLASFNFICQPSAFFRRDAFEAVGGLDETLQFAMDFDLWIKIGKRFPCRYLPGYLSSYRLHDASKTIRDDTLLKNIEEGLGLTLKHFGWAPLTRVYAWCNCACRSILPAPLSRFRFAVIVSALCCSVLRSLRLNRGLRKKDLKLLSLSNFRKLFKSRHEVMTGMKDPPS
jgi:glycosyltransferase involved in cell wall biosynthesis